MPMSKGIQAPPLRTRLLIAAVALSAAAVGLVNLWSEAPDARALFVAFVPLLAAWFFSGLRAGLKTLGAAVALLWGAAAVALHRGAEGLLSVAVLRATGTLLMICLALVIVAETLFIPRLSTRRRGRCACSHEEKAGGGA
ncbi:MAG: hypothetical protein JSV08_10035 [Acidobacteriota bacterium]|nr:MAG: hypothetical protein JSV08_10035 [Acidobacteriota bacterium]